MPLLCNSLHLCSRTRNWDVIIETSSIIYFCFRSGPESLRHGRQGRGAQGGRGLGGGGDVRPSHVQPEGRPNVRQLHHVRCQHVAELIEHHFIPGVGWSGLLLAVWRRSAPAWHTPPAAPGWSAPSDQGEALARFKRHYEAKQKMQPPLKLFQYIYNLAL